MSINIKIRELREKHKLTQREISALLGLTESNYRRLENNRVKTISLETLNILCSVYGCKVSDILEFVEDGQINS